VTESSSPRTLAVLDPDDVVCRDSVGRALLEAAARGISGQTVRDLGRIPILGRRGTVPPGIRFRELADEAAGQAVGGEAACGIDADAVAEWIVGQYPAVDHPAVVLGSPHGAAVHLASALGAPWLPLSFTVTVRRPGGATGDWSDAADDGARVAERILAANPSVTVRQIYDPVSRGPLCASTITLQVQWRRLPAAYQRLLRSGLRADGASLLIRDTRTWRVLELAQGHTFQVGSPLTGWHADDYSDDNLDFRRLRESLGMPAFRTPYAGTSFHYAETGGDPRCEPELRRLAAEHGHATHRVLYHGPETLSACVADLYREWLRCGYGTGEHCVVETGALLDPGQVLAAGLVPYWCESASQRAVTDAQWWLAGSESFTGVTVLPQPPGLDCGAYATAAQWRAVAQFARHRATVDPLAIRRYPLLPLPMSHTAGVLPSPSPAGARPERMSVAHALASLRRSSGSGGMLVL
jgi:hypothetical protein